MLLLLLILIEMLHLCELVLGALKLRLWNLRGRMEVGFREEGVWKRDLGEDNSDEFGLLRHREEYHSSIVGAREFDDSDLRINISVSGEEKLSGADLPSLCDQS